MAFDKNSRPVGEARTVLERPYHLSYPFLFTYDGVTYMIPESSENGAVELYRADSFPDRWRFVRNLIPDIDAADATLVHENGKWWLFANVRQAPGVSPWDELFLFFSDDPVSGRWESHPMNPIVSDCRSARPAGAFIRRGGRLGTFGEL